MTEGRKIRPGELLMVGLPGPELDATSRRLLQTYSIAGVILFSRNLRDIASLVALTDELHVLSAERPVLVAIDHEGGRVQRLNAPFTQFPSAAVVGAAGSPHLAYREGLGMGEELRAVGIDIDFAPVLDVHSNPKNPVIGDRSFGSHPRSVARMGVSLAHGLQHAGVVACGKHFPGHGDTDVDSHFDLPVVRKSLTEIERTELFPFRRAIAGGIDALMTAHVLFPALDPLRPATLSRRVMTGLLREQLHFRGVAFSDDLEMKAISDRYGAEDAAIEAIDAGADWLLFCEHLDEAISAVEALERAARKQSRLRERIEESAARIESLRRNHLRKTRRPRPDLATFQEGFPKHQKLVTWIEERAKGTRT